MHISVWKSLIFLQASRQKNKKKEGRKWLAVFTKTSLFYKKSCKNFPLLQKFMQKLPSFTKKSKKVQKNFPLLQKNFPLLQKKLPSFTKNQKKQNFPLLQKTKKTKKPKCFGGFKTAIRSGM